MSGRQAFPDTLGLPHDVRLHHTGVKHFQHSAVGRLDLTFNAKEIPRLRPDCARSFKDEGDGVIRGEHVRA
jgi:hypothetical protein